MMTTLVYVAFGGALGASARFLAGVGLVRMFGFNTFPLGVISVNIVGSFLMGLFVVTAAHKGLSHLNPFVMTGVLGGFTTFSAFSLETVTLYERGEIWLAALYVMLSVGGSISGLAAGMILARGFWA